MEEEESGIKVVRSVVAGILLKIYWKFLPFTPIQSRNILYYLQNDHLLSEFEKQAMLRVGKRNLDEKQTLMSAINFALLSIETDTGAVSCFTSFGIDFDTGVVYDRLTIMSVQPDKLVAELSPVSLHFENLCLTSEDMFPDLQAEHDRKLEIEQLLSEFSCNCHKLFN